MKHLGSTLLKFAFGSALSLSFLVLVAAPATPTPQDKVTICHATSSVSNPYVQETVNENAVVKSNRQPHGHATHTGPVFPQTGWGDIIPPFHYTNDQGGTSTYPGLNWRTDGQAIWSGGCLVELVPPEPIVEPTTTTTTQPAVTTTSAATTSTTTPSGSTTSQPGGSTTTSLVPASTSTTAHPATTTSTTIPLRPASTPTTRPPSEQLPPLTDPGGGAEIMPVTEAVVVDPHDHVVNLGLLSVSERESLEAEVDASAPPTTTTSQPQPPLAGTGVNVTAMALTSCGLVSLGALLILASRRLWRREAEWTED